MKLYLLMLIILLIIISGCTQTGDVTETITKDAEPAETTGNAQTALDEETKETDLCPDAVCGEIITTCPDGFVSTCVNPCDSDTGDCMPCKPDCTGHEIEETQVTGCDIYCDPTECKSLDEEKCGCVIELFCDGNGICEQGEYPGSPDCPVCNDNDPCTQDYYDYDLKYCVYDATLPCCGNLECEEGEDENNCPNDCLEEQVGDVMITDLDEVEEWVELDGYNVVMAGWTLSDWMEKHVYTFPEWFMINGKVRLHRGYGEDNETTLFWQSNSYMWNNDGDNATLKDSSGEIVDFYNYP